MSDDIITVNIENKSHTEAKWTILEGKLPEGVYLLRAKDIKGNWFDKKARFERNKGWNEASAEEWAHKRRPNKSEGILAEKMMDLRSILSDIPTMTPEQMREQETNRIRRQVEQEEKKRFSLQEIFASSGSTVQKKKDVVLKRYSVEDMRLNHIYNGDCISLMKKFPSNFADAVVTDPPYNLGKKYKSGIDDAMRADDYYKWSYRWIDEALRILKPNGQIFIALWDTFKYHIKVYIDEKWGHKFRFIEEIAWETTGVPRPGSGKLRSDYTPWLHFGPSRKKDQPAINYTHNVDSVRSWKFVKHKKMRKKVGRYVHPLGKDPGTLMRFFTEDEKHTTQHQNFYVLNWLRKFLEHVADYGTKELFNLFDVPSNIVTKRNLPGTHKDRLDHPCQMPIEVPMRLIELSTNPGDIVLEPFVGSGTTPAACTVLGRNCVGTELSSDYTLMALGRLQQKELLKKAAVEYWDSRPPEWTSDPCTPQFTDPGEKSLLDFFAIGTAGARRLGAELVMDIAKELQTSEFMTGNFQL